MRYLLDDLSEPDKDNSQDENFNYYYYQRCWLAVDVDLSAVSDKQKRVNVSLSAALLALMRLLMQIAKSNKDRSNFLAVAASHEIQRGRPQA